MTIFNSFKNAPRLCLDNASGRVFGFTLAEVLITLGIIGIVASMTIPTLMNNIQDRQFKEAAKEAFSISSQAVQKMKIDQGDDLKPYIAVFQSFKPVFMTYFKILKDCGLYSCVPNSSSIYKTLSNIPANAMFLDDGQFIISNGMFFAIDNPDGGAMGNHVWITVDVNGYKKQPNILGKDVFTFQIVNNNLLPMGAIGTNLSASTGYCDKSDAQSRTSLQGFGCMYNVMQGIDY